jgi:uncharacterized protein (PEP-CTERM system associated)
MHHTQQLTPALEEPAVPRLPMPQIEPPSGPVAPSAVGGFERRGFRLEPTLRASVTFTDNSNFGLRLPPQDELIFDVAPGFRVAGESSRLRLTGGLELIGRYFVNDTQTDRVLPSGNVLGTFDLYNGTVFLEAGVSAVQELIDPIGTVADTTSINNTQTSIQYSISPYVTRESTSGLNYLIRSDNTHSDTRRYGQPARPDASAADGYFGRHEARFEQRPRRIGWRLWYLRTDSQADVPLAQTDTYELARAALLLQLVDRLTIGARIGREHNNFALVGEQDGTIFGAEMNWRPTERTRVEGWWENRFFGSAWDGTFAHRMPWLVFEIVSSRDLATYQQLVFGLPTGGNVATLINEMLRTRVPDEAQRGRLVEELIARGRLPREVDGPANIYSDDVSRTQRLTARIAFIRMRHSITLSGYKSRTEDLSELGLGEVIGTGSSATNNQQSGGEAMYTLRVSPLDTVGASLRYYRARGLGDFSEEQSRQLVYRLEWTRMLAPHTFGLVQVRHQDFQFEADAGRERESALVLGIAHRY